MTLARKDTRKRAQERFLMCYEETVQVLKASRWAKVARSAHYRWLEEDPTYGPRFQAACSKADQRLVNGAVRRARNGDGPIWALLQWLRVQNQISEGLQGQEPTHLDTIRHLWTHLRARERAPCNNLRHLATNFDSPTRARETQAGRGSGDIRCVEGRRGVRYTRK